SKARVAMAVRSVALLDITPDSPEPVAADQDIARAVVGHRHSLGAIAHAVWRWDFRPLRVVGSQCAGHGWIDVATRGPRRPCVEVARRAGDAILIVGAQAFELAAAIGGADHATIASHVDFAIPGVEEL